MVSHTVLLGVTDVCRAIEMTVEMAVHGLVCSVQSTRGSDWSNDLLVHDHAAVAAYSEGHVSLEALRQDGGQLITVNS